MRAFTGGVEGLLIICLLLMGLRLSTGLETVVDLGFFDETGYLYAGTHRRFTFRRGNPRAFPSTGSGTAVGGANRFSGFSPELR